MNTGKTQSDGWVANRLFLIKATGAAVGYGFIVTLTQKLTLHDFGQVAFTLNSVFFLGIVAACGQHFVLLRELPLNLSREETFGLLKVSAWHNAKGVAFVTIAIGLLWWFAALPGLRESLPIENVLATIALLIAICTADFVAHAARGIQQHFLSVIPKEFAWRGLVTCALLFSTTIWNARNALWLMVIVLVVITIVQLWRVRDVVTESKEVSASRKAMRDGQGAFWLTSVSNHALALSDVIVVGIAFGPQIAGPYFVANRIAQVLAHFISAYNQVITPKISAAHRAGKVSSVEQIAVNAAKRMSLPIVFLTGLVLALAEPLLALFGAEFTVSATELRLLLCATMANAVIGPADIVLNMTGQEKRAVKVAVMTLCAAIIAFPFGAYLFGPAGVAGAVLIVTIVRKVLFWHLAFTVLGYRTDALARLEQGPHATLDRA